MADSLKTPVELCGHCGRDGEMVGHIHSYLDKRFLAVCISCCGPTTQSQQCHPDIWTTNKQTAQLVPAAGAGNDNSIFVSVPTTGGISHFFTLIHNLGFSTSLMILCNHRKKMPELPK